MKCKPKRGFFITYGTRRQIVINFAPIQKWDCYDIGDELVELHYHNVSLRTHRVTFEKYFNIDERGEEE